jgi:hypothetical protein
MRRLRGVNFGVEENVASNGGRAVTQQSATNANAVTKGLDVVLGTTLLTAVLLHGLHETGKLFASPLSDRLQGKPTFSWCSALLWCGLHGDIPLAAARQRQGGVAKDEPAKNKRKR